MKRKINPWTPAEKALLSRLTTPKKIQEYMDTLEYSGESRYRSPRSVMRDAKGHCFDGAVFAAAALSMLGYPPMIVDMQAVRDDDHVIAVFKRNGAWGALAKSNFTGLRFREPVYRSIRELVMSYFESFYNVNREKTLRRFTRPLPLAAYERYDWMTNDEAMELIGTKLCYIKTHAILTPAMIRALHPIDDRAYEAGLHGAIMGGLYDPNKKS